MPGHSALALDFADAAGRIATIPDAPQRVSAIVFWPLDGPWEATSAGLRFARAGGGDTRRPGPHRTTKFPPEIRLTRKPSECPQRSDETVRLDASDRFRHAILAKKP